MENSEINIDNLEDIKEENDTILDSDPVPLARPRNNCICNGTGRRAYNSETKRGIPCKCLYRLPDTDKNTGDVLYLTHGEWLNITGERDNEWEDMKKRKRQYREYKRSNKKLEEQK